MTSLMNKYPNFALIEKVGWRVKWRSGGGIIYFNFFKISATSYFKNSSVYKSKV